MWARGGCWRARVKRASARMSGVCPGRRPWRRSLQAGKPVCAAVWASRHFLRDKVRCPALGVEDQSEGICEGEGERTKPDAERELGFKSLSRESARVYCRILSAFSNVQGVSRRAHLRNPSARAPQNAWAGCWCEIRWCRASDTKGHMEEGERAKAHRRAGCLHRYSCKKRCRG